MPFESFDRASNRPRARIRTLIAKDGAIWMWPGLPLAIERNDAIQPLPHNWIRFWIRALHGFERRTFPIEAALALACKYLAVPDENNAQAVLDSASIDCLSPEGAALVRTVAAEFGIAPLELPVGNRGLPWGSGSQPFQMQLLRRFGRATEVFEKGGNPNQPRWPKGAPDSQGGRYAPSNASAGPDAPEIGSPGIGHNGGPPLDDPPNIPEEAPASTQVRNAIIKDLAVWLLRRGIVALIPGVGEAAAIVSLGLWLYDELPVLDAYLRPPQSLEDLQDAVSTPQKGTQVHHIVEQEPARQAGFSNQEIDAPDNTVRISTLKHWQISGWSSTPNAEPPYNGLSPRNYLRDKSWAER